MKKIYSSTKDGDESTNFHKKCEGFNNTLVLLKTSGNYRFGGFTSDTWNSTGGYKNDQNAFIFSLNKKKIYDYNKNGYAIYCNNGNGPTFGGANDINVCDKRFHQINSYVYEGGGNHSYSGNDYKLTENSYGNKLLMSEVEVFQVVL